MNRFNNLDYGQVIGIVRVFESKLIKDDEFLKLKACKSVDEFKLELKNINYNISDFLDFSDFCLKLDKIFNELVFNIKKSCPIFVPFDLIFFENDCFNLKSILFVRRHGIVCRDFILRPGFLPVSLIESCVAENNFFNLPVPFRFLADMLNRMFSEGVSNFDVFNIFEKKVFELKFDLFKVDKFLLERTKLQADLYNLRLVLKALKFNFNEIILEKVLVSGGVVNSCLVLKAFREGVVSLEKLFKTSLSFSLNKMLGDFDLVDELFFKKISDFDFSMRVLPFSFAALVSYFSELQHEHKNLKKILINLYFN